MALAPAARARYLIGMRRGLVLLLLAGCGSSGGSGTEPAPPVTAVAAAPAADTTCAGPPVGQPQGWRHSGSRAVATLLGDPAHAASDPVVNPGADALVEGKFAYGPASKDLQDEEITLWLQVRCGQWAPITTVRTDADGRARFQVPAARIPLIGAYAVQLVVRGDLSRAYSYVYVVPRGTVAVLFDIDGTLTTGDGQLVKELIGSDAAVRPGAADVVRRHVGAGHMPIYMSGRSYNLRELTRDWLRRNGFPRGPLLTTERIGQALPGEGRVGRFKRAAIEVLTGGAGVDIRYAYGNASTDVCAYAEAGLPPDRTYIIGVHGGDACTGHPPTHAIADYREHLPALEALLGAAAPPAP